MYLGQIRNYRLTKIFINRPAIKQEEKTYKINRKSDRKLYLAQVKKAKQKRLRRHP